MTPLAVVSVALNLILAIALVGAASLGPVATASYSEEIPPGLAIRMSAKEVAAKATERLDAMASQAGGLGVGKPTRILQIIAGKGEDLENIEPRAAGAVPADQIVWVVRGEGTFIAARGLRSEPRVFSSGYFLIDDLTGDILGMGMP